MCFSGGFALAMMVDDCVAAPVVAEPSLPVPVGKARAATTWASAQRTWRRSADGLFKGALCWGCATGRTDGPAPASTPSTRQLGDGFIAVELEGKGRATLS